MSQYCAGLSIERIQSWVDTLTAVTPEAVMKAAAEEIRLEASVTGCPQFQLVSGGRCANDDPPPPSRATAARQTASEELFAKTRS